MVLGEFYTKNGLPYSGFMADSDIDSNSQLIIVPKNLLLTTKIAYMSDIKKVF